MIFFIQDCPFNKIDSILRQADEIGLISDYHNYLITNMVKDLQEIDIFEKIKLLTNQMSTLSGLFRNLVKGNHFQLISHMLFYVRCMWEIL